VFRTLRPVDLVVVSIVFLGAITATLQICGAHDPMAMFALIVGWTWPATRGIARWRSQGSPRRGVSLDGHLTTITLAALGAAWWFALPVVVQLRSGALLAPLGHFRNGDDVAIGVRFGVGLFHGGGVACVRPGTRRSSAPRSAR